MTGTGRTLAGQLPRVRHRCAAKATLAASRFTSASAADDDPNEAAPVEGDFSGTPVLAGDHNQEAAPALNAIST